MVVFAELLVAGDCLVGFLSWFKMRGGSDDEVSSVESAEQGWVSVCRREKEESINVQCICLRGFYNVCMQFRRPKGYKEPCWLLNCLRTD